jgi:hypothetical protein
MLLRLEVVDGDAAMFMSRTVLSALALLRGVMI